MVAKDIAWLRDGIASALHWDAETADGVAQAIAAEESPSEVNGILQDFCGSNVDVVALVQVYRSSQPSSAPAVRTRPHISAAPANATAQRGSSARGFTLSTQRGLGNSRDQIQGTGEPTVDGLRVKRNPSKATKAAANDAASASAGVRQTPTLERLMCNCLGCGKIYDCRGTLSASTAAFVESGGVCTFCGLKVSLNRRERSQTRDSSAAATRSTPAAKEAAEAKVGASEANDASEKTAIAFKNRLVAADRDGAKRTAVLDDQADFFEIDNNTWLSEEEKRALRTQQKAVSDAQEARQKRFTVSFDMLGRQVILSDEPNEPTEEAACDSSAATSDAAAAASAATAREIPQGGGTATLAAAAAATYLRIPRNPGLEVQPMFVRPPAKPERGASSDRKPGGPLSSRKNERHGPARPPGIVNGKQSTTTQSRQKRSRAKGARQLPRLQHDDSTSAAIAPEM